jgi:hypothetical protein
MRRLLAVVLVLLAVFFAASPADAFWRHHGWGWGHRWGGWGWGHRYYRPWGFGYRGWGYPYYGGYRGIGFGYPYYGGYGYGYPYGGYYSYPSYYGGYGYGCYNTVTPGTSVGYPAYGTGVYAASPVQAPTGIPTAAPAPGIFAAGPARAAAPTSAVTAPPTALALQKFLGLKDIHPVSISPAASAAVAARFPVVTKAIGDVLARATNVESHRKAEKMISEADELFRAQNYHSALQRYKLAASTAPDMPEALWRQGHALVATHNYELAATAFKRAVGLTDDLDRGGFHLSDIYGSANMTKNQHLESLADWALTHRNSSDPYFLLGLFLEYDEQPARAEKFFQKASDLAGISGGHIAVFLAPAEPAGHASVAPVPAPLTPAARPAASRPAPVPAVIPISTGTEI